jgi:hypothetical protein
MNTPKGRERMGFNWLGRRHSDETRRLISRRQKARWARTRTQQGM